MVRRPRRVRSREAITCFRWNGTKELTRMEGSNFDGMKVKELTNMEGSNVCALFLQWI